MPGKRLRNDFMSKIQIGLFLMLLCIHTQAQLVVTVSSPKITGQKAVVPLTMKNNFTEKVESARAVVFLLDGDGKMVGQSTRWVIGGAKDQPALESKSETKFNFVIPATKPVVTTNLTAKVNFTRVVLEGGELADVSKTVTVTPAAK